MGDRCYLEITLRRADLDRFGKHLDVAPGAPRAANTDRMRSYPSGRSTWKPSATTTANWSSPWTKT